MISTVAHAPPPPSFSLARYVVQHVSQSKLYVNKLRLENALREKPFFCIKIDDMKVVK